MTEKKDRAANAWSGSENAASRRNILVTGPIPGRQAREGLQAQTPAPVESRRAMGNSGYTGSLCRLFFEESEPFKALDLALRIFSRSYMGGGRTRVRVWKPNRVEVRFPAQGSEGRPSCASTLAYLRDAIHLATGGRVEAREERCVRRGDSCCSHHLWWETPGA